MNYYYDSENHILEVYYGDTLLVEMPYCDPMNENEAQKLASELFEEYLENQE